MFRFLKFWIRPEYEDCIGCAILKQQLKETNQEKKDLLELVMSLVRPTPIQIERPKVNVTQAIPRDTTWTRRRHRLEERDRIEAQLRRNSPFIAASNEELEKQKQETVAALEKEIDDLEREVTPNVS